MQDFPANSAKARAQSEGRDPERGPERIERVTSAEASRRKRGLGSQFKNTFINGNARMAADYMFAEIVVPAIRDLVFDAFQGGLDRLIYGERRSRRGGTASSYSEVGRVNYAGISSNRPSSSTSASTRTLSRQARARQDFDEVVIPSRVEAEEVLDRLFEFLSRYGIVRVSELYAMTGIATDHTDHKWGWTSLRGAKVVRLRSGGFLLDLPEPEALTA
ncbi:MAG: hypothetical protein ACJ8BW_08315 [Ktedonobacteraceae bacterium]|jgi:hypothetical protein